MRRLRYVQAFEEWAALSGRLFSPANIGEEWESEIDEVRLHFTLAGARHVLKPRVRDDWLDLGVLRQVNRLLSPGPHRFHFVDLGQAGLVLWLDDAARNRLEKVDPLFTGLAT